MRKTSRPSTFPSLRNNIRDQSRRDGQMTECAALSRRFGFTGKLGIEFITFFDEAIELLPRNIKARSVVRVGVFVGLAALCALIHWRAGTYQSEFGRYSDEGMHYVTGLLIRDFA